MGKYLQKLKDLTREDIILRSHSLKILQHTNETQLRNHLMQSIQRTTAVKKAHRRDIGINPTDAVRLHLR